MEKPVDFDVLYADRFFLVAEVLSDSNTDKDIAAKSRRYIQHPLNLYFLLIEQKQVRVELRTRAGGWEPVELKGPMLFSSCQNGASTFRWRLSMRAHSSV